MTLSNTAIPTGLYIASQIPFDNKTYFLSESVLLDLGAANNLAYTYFKGMQVYCATEASRYEWRETTIIGEIGLLPVSFTYPIPWIKEGIDYSGLSFNFYKIELYSDSPFQLTDQGNGNGIIIRHRDNDHYLPIGEGALDISFNNNTSPIKGAGGKYSFASGFKTIASGEKSCTFNEESWASGYGSFAAVGGTASNFLCFAIRGTASGFGSFAFGEDVVSSGNGTFASGNNSLASGSVATASGTSTKATGSNSNARNFQSEAIGVASSSEGFLSKARGDVSHAGGALNEANSYCETNIGSVGTIAAAIDTSGGVPAELTDRVFNIGNGYVSNIDATIHRSDAFTVLKSGLTTLPSITNSIIEQADDKAVVTKGYVLKQKILIHPTDFAGTVYTLTDDDNYSVILVESLVPVTIATDSPTKPSVFRCTIYQTNIGTVTVNATGGGSFIERIGAATGGLSVIIAGRYGRCDIEKVKSTTSFLASGDLVGSAGVALTGELKMLNVLPAVIAANTDGTGLGINAWTGWALCNGNNGTRAMNGKVPLGYGTGFTTIPATVGTNNLTLVANNIPPLDITSIFSSNDNSGGPYSFLMGNDIDADGAQVLTDRVNATSPSTPISVMQSSEVVVYLQKL